MTDIVDPARRSEMMGRIRAKDSAAELAVRSALHALGYRFRLHVRSLPGKPDVVLAQYPVSYTHLTLPTIYSV